MWQNIEKCDKGDSYKHEYNFIQTADATEWRFAVFQQHHDAVG